MEFDHIRAKLQVVAYGVARPAREVLFTVVSREEKYKAKIVIDTLVQRMGDALAAALFSVLQSGLGAGPSVVALAALPACAVWAVLAATLGARQQVRVSSCTALEKHRW